jgi:hypothetical protein
MGRIEENSTFVILMTPGGILKNSKKKIDNYTDSIHPNLCARLKKFTVFVRVFSVLPQFRTFSSIFPLYIYINTVNHYEP